MPKTQYSEVAKASREQAGRIRERILQLPESDRTKVNECIEVIREFMKQSGNYGVLAVSLVYWEFSFAAAVGQTIRSADEPHQDPQKG